MSDAISHFVSLLDQWSYHYPLPSQWAVEIPLPGGINSSLEENIRQLEHPEWGISSALSELTKYEVLKKDTVHCFFVDTVNLAGESYSIQSTTIGEGSINGGLIPGIYSGGRQDFSSRSVSIGFRETAYSFADFVIRPWIILAAHLGRIADQNNQIKADITVYSYGKSYSNSNRPVIRKIYRYYGCVPAKIEAQTLKYGEDSNIITYNTEWFFDRYSISTGEGSSTNPDLQPIESMPTNTSTNPSQPANRSSYSTPPQRRPSIGTPLQSSGRVRPVASISQPFIQDGTSLDYGAIGAEPPLPLPGGN